MSGGFLTPDALKKLVDRAEQLAADMPDTDPELTHTIDACARACNLTISPELRRFVVVLAMLWQIGEKKR